MELEKPLEKSYIEDRLGLDNLAFLVAVDFDGNYRVFPAPGTKPQPLSFDKPIATKEIRNIDAAAIVAFAGSQCVAWRSIGGGVYVCKQTA